MSEEISARVAAALAEKPTSALEDIAKRANVRVIDVVRNLPDGEAHCVDGEHFVDVMQSMRNWGDITFIVNTGTVIFEAKGQIPDGSLGHGYYNLHGKPIGGHLKADACELIAFVSRTFMNSETHSVQFYAKDGTCMFKVYLGRDEDRNILPGQVDAFKTLRDRITG
ncbi:heme utilization cystosolic carrier protein HutX [uncultured Cohaesibacter sp.]|uniref:heme utilization cystosolic carrier protein HutX n=1 Tax=uncultured Cohaesibacter sp. TaxID=1002546 RepID=UPI0029C843D2|nr:heme utilization cystosolic carrier protein HutX [uncultured Cohaesibacter sp.]